MLATPKINLRLSITVLIACAFEPILQAQQADQIFYNGKILIVDSNFSVAEAVAVKSGRISAVGSVAELSSRVGPSTERFDLKGRTVIPGLIDNHMHYMRGASR